LRIRGINFVDLLGSVFDAQRGETMLVLTDARSALLTRARANAEHSPIAPETDIFCNRPRRKMLQMLYRRDPRDGRFAGRTCDACRINNIIDSEANLLRAPSFAVYRN